MKRRTKWILITISAVIAIPILTVTVIIFLIFKKPTIKPIPEAYLHAKQIWSLESGEAVLNLQVETFATKIDVNSAPISGTTIRYPDEESDRDIYRLEIYFGASEIKYDVKYCIIYIKVAGVDPVSGRSGERIFEYDARRRAPVRDYWVTVSN